MKQQLIQYSILKYFTFKNLMYAYKFLFTVASEVCIPSNKVV